MTTQALHDHLKTGLTHVARCWDIIRSDGARFSFTDHDADLTFENRLYTPSQSVSGRELHQTSGLSVDNSEAFGALTHDALTEADIMAGRFDGAQVIAWLVNWQNTQERKILFRGQLGEIRRNGGAFDAELRGLTDLLNQPQGRTFQRSCSAVLGDGRCKFDLATAGFRFDVPIETVEDETRLLFGTSLLGVAEGWFDRGRLEILDGPGIGLVGVIKRDLIVGGVRRVDLWQSMPFGLQPGVTVRLEAGCDKRISSCQAKFSNALNFQGFPHIPGEDWLMSVPVNTQVNDGGPLR